MTVALINGKRPAFKSKQFHFLLCYRSLSIIHLVPCFFFQIGVTSFLSSPFHFFLVVEEKASFISFTNSLAFDRLGNQHRSLKFNRIQFILGRFFAYSVQLKICRLAAHRESVAICVTNFQEDCRMLRVALCLSLKHSTPEAVINLCDTTMIKSAS